MKSDADRCPARRHQPRSVRIHGRAGDRGQGIELCTQIPVCAVDGVLLMTESPADVVSMLLGLGWLVLSAGGAHGSAEDRSSCAVGSGGLVAAGPDGREPAADAEPGQGGAPLLGARGVIAAILIVWRCH